MMGQPPLRPSDPEAWPGESESEAGQGTHRKILNTLFCCLRSSEMRPPCWRCSAGVDQSMTSFEILSPRNVKKQWPGGVKARQRGEGQQPGLQSASRGGSSTSPCSEICSELLSSLVPRDFSTMVRIT